MREWIEPMLLPPLSCFLLGLFGLLIVRWKRRLGITAMVTAFLALWVCATPLFAVTLLRALQTENALPRDFHDPKAQAIVVLSADMDRLAPEYGGPTPGAMSLQRLRYAAALHRQTGVPILVSGGVPAVGFPSHAETMERVLEDEYGAAVRWSEGKSANTWENARKSVELLARDEIDRIYLVTHAWHMPRSVAAFEALGVHVVPAPTGFRAPATEIGPALVPRWTALRDTGLALHELLGIVWYELAYY